MADTLPLFADLKGFVLQGIAAELLGLPPVERHPDSDVRRECRMVPACRAGAVDKKKLLAKRHPQPVSRREVTGWAFKLAAWLPQLGLPSRGRAVRAIYDAMRSFMDWKTGRLDPAGSAIAEQACYSPSSFWVWKNWMVEHRIIAVIPTCRRLVLANGSFIIQQDTNVYVLLPPSQWKGYVAKPSPPPPPPPDPDAWGAKPPMSEAEAHPDIAPAILKLRSKLHEAEARLITDPTNAGTAALIRLYRDNLAALDPPS